jgi:hypothetical protein
VSRWLFWMLLGSLSPGCALFEQLKDTIESLTEPVLMQGMAVGLSMPDPSWGIDLTGTEYEGGSMIQVWVTDANTTSGVSPARNARVSFLSDANGSVGLSEQEPGHYMATGGDGMGYSPNDDVSIVADYAGERHSISMRTPPAADVNIPTDHTPDLGLSVDLRGQGFDNAVVVVFDVTDGRAFEVWRSDFDETEPRDSSNLFQSIDGSVFQANHAFVVGVSGLNAADENDFAGLQTLGSGMMAGSMVLYPLFTFSSFDTGF